uniref:Uncharacterized protein n=1 Tax=Mimivirus LCMiAC02 TaxID=2506609 RepID=A0A4D5XF25_9VIRU|nr:MAG: uncharacterized protein LCMiAC02_04350 [Mimivirus LCMiAC02]
MSSKKSSKKSSRDFIPPVPIKKFDPNRFSVKKLDMDNPKAKAQGIGFPEYEHKRYEPTNVIIITDWMHISNYGIPRSTADDPDNNYYDKDTQRSFLKCPIDTQQPACVVFGNKLKELDVKLSSKKFKKKLFRNIDPDVPDMYKMFKYTKIVRLPKVQLGKNKNKNKKFDGPPVEYCKLRFDMDWNTKEIETRVFVCENTEDEGKEVETKTLAQMEKYVGWGCDVRMIIMFNKLWAAKTPDNDDKCGYGVTMKICQLLVIPRSSSSSKEQFKKNRFGSKYRDESGSDTEDETEETTQKTQETKDEKSDSDSEDEKDDKKDDEEDGSDSDEEPPKKQKKRKRRTHKSDDSDGSDSEGERSSKKKKKRRKHS